MEVSVEGIEGAALPAASYVSIKLGDALRHGRYVPSRVYRFPEATRRRQKNAQIDIFRLVGSANVDVDPEVGQVVNNVCLTGSDPQMNIENINLEVHAKPFAASSPKETTARKDDPKKNAWGYLQATGIQQSLAQGLQQLVEAQPEDPMEFLCRYLQQHKPPPATGAAHASPLLSRELPKASDSFETSFDSSPPSRSRELSSPSRSPSVPKRKQYVKTVDYVDVHHWQNMYEQGNADQLLGSQSRNRQQSPPQNTEYARTVDYVDVHHWQNELDASENCQQLDNSRSLDEGLLDESSNMLTDTTPVDAKLSREPDDNITAEELVKKPLDASDDNVQEEEVAAPNASPAAAPHDSCQEKVPLTAREESCGASRVTLRSVYSSAELPSLIRRASWHLGAEVLRCVYSGVSTAPDRCASREFIDMPPSCSFETEVPTELQLQKLAAATAEQDARVAAKEAVEAAVAAVLPRVLEAAKSRSTVSDGDHCLSQQCLSKVEAKAIGIADARMQEVRDQVCPSGQAEKLDLAAESDDAMASPAIACGSKLNATGTTGSTTYTSGFFAGVEVEDFYFDGEEAEDENEFVGVEEDAAEIAKAETERVVLRAETERAWQSAETEGAFSEPSNTLAESISASDPSASEAVAPGLSAEAKSGLGNRSGQGAEAVDDKESLAESDELDVESNDVERAESLDGA